MNSMTIRRAAEGRGWELLRDGIVFQTYPKRSDAREAKQHLQLCEVNERARLRKPSVPLHPDVSVQLTGTDGNAFALLGKVRQALMRAQVDPQDVERFNDEATSGDYDDLLATCMRWVDVR